MLVEIHKAARSCWCQRRRATVSACRQRPAVAISRCPVRERDRLNHTLGLKIEDFLERRPQTQVLKWVWAKSSNMRVR